MNTEKGRLAAAARDVAMAMNKVTGGRLVVPLVSREGAQVAVTALAPRFDAADTRHVATWTAYRLSLGKPEQAVLDAARGRLEDLARSCGMDPARMGGREGGREVEAFAYGVWSAARRRSAGSVDGAVQNSFNGFRTMLERVRSALAGHGFASVEDVFRSAERAAREPVPAVPPANRGGVMARVFGLVDEGAPSAAAPAFAR